MEIWILSNKALLEIPVGSVLANVSTDKANKAEQKEGSTVNISDLLEKVKESSEGTDDDRDD
ncbi:hypothetical protein ACOJBZ_16970 [Enterococcus innesii]|uniref:hypothetical protein n=1 Tax=Enterococcus innesii TaxID=2839759 RepID=UPI003B5CA2C9